MNILKINLIFALLGNNIIFLFKRCLFSGISENSLNGKENYQKINYSKDDVITMIGSPIIKKTQIICGFMGRIKSIAAFKQTIYNRP